MSEFICECTFCFALYSWGLRVFFAHLSFICIWRFWGHFLPSGEYFSREVSSVRTSRCSSENIFILLKDFHWVHSSRLTVVFSQSSEAMISFPLPLTRQRNCLLFTSFVFSGCFSDSSLYLWCLVILVILEWISFILPVMHGSSYAWGFIDFMNSREFSTIISIMCLLFILFIISFHKMDWMCVIPF